VKIEAAIVYCSFFYEMFLPERFFQYAVEFTPNTQFKKNCFAIGLTSSAAASKPVPLPPSGLGTTAYKALTNFFFRCRC